RNVYCDSPRLVMCGCGFPARFILEIDTRDPARCDLDNKHVRIAISKTNKKPPRYLTQGLLAARDTGAGSAFVATLAPTCQLGAVAAGCLASPTSPHASLLEVSGFLT